MKAKLKVGAVVGLFSLWSYLTIYSFGYGHKLVYCLATLLLLIGVSHLSKSCAKTLVVIFSLIALLLYPVTAMFGTPNANMLAAIKYTSWEEGAEIWHILMSTWLLIGFINLILGFFVLKLISRINVNSNTYALTLITLFSLAIFYKPFFANTSGDYISEFGYPPVRFLADIVHGWGKIVNYEYLSGQGRHKESDFLVTRKKKTYKTYILVVGESARRDYMGLYGYNKKNTPFASASNGIFFDNYVSAGPSTVISLTNSFLRNNHGYLEFNNSIIDIAKKSDIYTYWISNQGRFGIYDGPVAEIGKKSNYSYFIKKSDSQDGEYYPDEKLLPEIEKALGNKTNKLIVIHLMGSHPSFCARTNWKYEVFHVNDEISCYMQSIKNTDAFLKKISDLAYQTHSSWSMMYFSDHGLAHTNNSSTLVHSDKNKQNYSVPFFVISSDSTKIVRIDEPRSGLDFQKIFMQWIGIKEEKTLFECNYFANEHCDESLKVIDANYGIKDYDALADDPAI